MIIDLKEYAKNLFKTAQRPIAWLLSAERLRDAAEAILAHELPNEVPYFRAYDDAERDALAEACSPGNDIGVAEIKAAPPNYPPAQLLYAYAIENLLKGLVVANTPGLIQERQLSVELKTHDLIKLADKAQFQVHAHETPILEGLSKLSLWAGRYPVALTRREHVGSLNSDELLDYGSANPVMRGFFERAYKALVGQLPHPIGSRAITRPPGT
jgi:hypothetical protein